MVETVTLAGMRVLVVEDEAMIAMMLEDLLESLGCVVAASASGIEEAMVKAAEARIDVAMLDVNLSGSLTYPVADVLRSRGIPFLFVTGYGAQGLPEHLRDAPLLAKPFSERKLARMLAVARAADFGGGGG